MPSAEFALCMVGYDNVRCSSLVLSIIAGSRRSQAVNPQNIYVPLGLVNSKKTCSLMRLQAGKLQKPILGDLWWLGQRLLLQAVWSLPVIGLGLLGLLRF